MADHLTDQSTRHWTGTEQPLVGLARIDGANYRYMGPYPHGVPAMKQDSVDVEATHTVYVFEAAGIRLEVEFFTPAFPQDLTLLSRPATYLTWKGRAWMTAATKWTCCSMLTDGSRWTRTMRP